jgi:hypothetical protein
MHAQYLQRQQGTHLVAVGTKLHLPPSVPMAETDVVVSALIIDLMPLTAS